MATNSYLRALSAPTRSTVAEWQPHACTWMQWPGVWPGGARAWGVGAARRAVARLAETIGRFEPVRMIVHPDDVADARRLLGNRVDWVVMPVDDMWARDSGPVFVRQTDGTLAVVNLGFNGWGNKQRCYHDTSVSRRVAEHLSLPSVSAGFIAEGGAFDHDGEGTWLSTRSVLLNPNRNPDFTGGQIEQLMTRTFGAKKILWLEGVRGRDITDGHVDAYARFVAPAHVVVERRPVGEQSPEAVESHRAIQQLSQARDASGRRIDVSSLTAPAYHPVGGAGFCASYSNFYICNDAVIVAAYGSTRDDDRAHGTLADLFPTRRIIPIELNGIFAHGGGIHCVTQHQPKV